MIKTLYMVGAVAWLISFELAIFAMCLNVNVWFTLSQLLIALCSLWNVKMCLRWYEEED